MDLLAIGLAVWAWALSRRQGAPRWLRVVPWLLAAGFVLSFGGTLLGLNAAFRDVEHLEPAKKAEFLSRGIAHAIGRWVARYRIQRPVSTLLLSNRTCGFPAYGFTGVFTGSLHSLG